MACSRSFLRFFCILFIVFIGSPIAILITLSYVGVEPRFYVQQLYVLHWLLHCPWILQGRKKTVHWKAVVEARGLPWEDAFQKISGGLTVALAVELATKYKLKQCDGDGDCSYSKPKAVVVAADVRLDGSGEKVSKKPLRLH